MNTKIIAHRGSSFIAPENTLAAFKLGIEQGADGIEGDFHLSKDEKVVCIHDESAKRTTGIDLCIKKSTFDEIRELDAGILKGDKWKGEKIPTFSEILEILPENKKIYIEIKSDFRILGYIKKVLENKNLPNEKVHFISFSVETIAKIKQLLPQYKAFWLTNFKDENGVFLGFDKVMQILKNIKADGVDCLADKYVTEEFVALMRENDLELHCWTVDDVETAQKFVDLGFDSITTNRPDLLIKNLKYNI